MNPDRPQEQHQYVLSCVSGSTHHCSCGCCRYHCWCSGGVAIVKRLLTTAKQKLSVFNKWPNIMRKKFFSSCTKFNLIFLCTFSNALFILDLPFGQSTSSLMWEWGATKISLEFSGFHDKTFKKKNQLALKPTLKNAIEHLTNSQHLRCNLPLFFGIGIELKTFFLKNWQTFQTLFNSIWCNLLVVLEWKFQVN